MAKGFDPAAFLPTFITEAREWIGRMNQGLLALEARPEDREAFRSVLRDAHTLKGASKMMGLVKIGSLAHRMEDVLVAVEEKERPIAGDLADLFFEALDSVSALVDGVARGDAEADVDGLIHRLGAAAREATAAAPEAAPLGPGEGQKTEPGLRRGPDLQSALFMLRGPWGAWRTAREGVWAGLRACREIAGGSSAVFLLTEIPNGSMVSPSDRFVSGGSP